VLVWNPSQLPKETKSMKHRTETRDIAAAEAVTHSRAAAEEASSSVAVPCEDRIRDFAHQKWQSAGCPEDADIAFWLEAERELASQTTQDDAQRTRGENDDTIGF